MSKLEVRKPFWGPNGDLGRVCHGSISDIVSHKVSRAAGRLALTHLQAAFIHDRLSFLSESVYSPQESMPDAVF